LVLNGVVRLRLHSNLGGTALQIEQHGGLLRSFLDVSLHLTQGLDIRHVLNVVVDRAMTLTGAPYGAAATVSNGTIDDFVHRGLTPAEVEALPHPPRGLGLLGAVINGMVVIRSERLADHPGSIGFPGHHVRMEAFMGVPMVQRDEALGALFLTKPPGAEPFTDSDEEILLAMASMAAVGISNARLFRAEADRAERTQTLRDITTRVRGSLDVDDVLNQTAEQIGRAARADRCFIRLMDASDGELGLIGHEWTDDGVEPAGETGLQFPVSTLAARTGKTQSVSDVLTDVRLNDPSLPSPGNLLQVGTHAVLATPLLWGGEVMGVVACHSVTPREWRESDVALVEAAAREVSVALHHARLYEAAVDTAAKLRELDQLRSDFVSMVSHELRSPMTVVGGIAHLLEWRRDKLSDKEIDELLQSLGREARRLTRLVSEFLDMEAMERGRFTLDQAEFDVLELAVEAMVDAGYAQRTEVSSTAADAAVTADRDRVKQVLLNLLTNAAKFSPDDQNVLVEVDPGPNEVRVSVSDRGPGIPPEEQKNLFRRFSKLSTTVGRAPGSGFGLYVSRTIVELHGGRMWVESMPGEGAKFIFSLPR
jgi:signal transduction histidine kinase